MPNNQPQISLAQLAQFFQQQQQQGQMADPNVTIQPTGRYIGNQWSPNNMDQMVSPFGGAMPPDRNTLNPEDIMSLGLRRRQEHI